MVTIRGGGSSWATGPGSMLARGWMTGIPLDTTLSEWQCPLCWCPGAMATVVWPSKRQRGAHTIHDWARRKAASIATAASRARGREWACLEDTALGTIKLEASRDAPGTTGPPGPT
jgi:hypothetical protein